MAKRLILFFFIFLTSVACGQLNINPECSQVNITIQVKTDKADSMNLIVSGGCGGESKVSFIPKNGTFTYTGLINRACEGLIFTDTKNKVSLDGPSVIRFLIEPGKMSVSFSMEDNLPKKIAITGSKSEKEKETWQSQFSPVFTFENRYNEELNELNKNYPEDTTDEMLKRRQKVITKLEAIKDIKASLALEFVHKNPASYLSAYLLFMHALIMPPDSVARAYLSLDTEVAQSQIGINAGNKIMKFTGDREFIRRYTDSGFTQKWDGLKDIYDLTASDIDGKQINFSIFKGKYLFIDFWATWCGPCINIGLPKLHEAFSETSDLPINYISISIDDLSEYEKWKKFVSEFKFPGINVFDNDKFLRTYFKVLLLPTWIIVNPRGEIISRDIYGSDKPLGEFIRYLIEEET